MRGRRSGMAGTCAVLVLFGMAIGGQLAAAGGPKIKLDATSGNLFTPARCFVTAKLSGGSDADPALMCLTEEWEYSRTYQTFTNRETNRSIRKADCDDQTQPSAVIRSFKNDFFFAQPGRYLIRLILRNRDGKMVASETTSVNVIQSAQPMDSAQ